MQFINKSENVLSLKEERYVMRRLAEEFLTMMDYKPIPCRVRSLAAHLVHFEKKDALRHKLAY